MADGETLRTLADSARNGGWLREQGYSMTTAIATPAATPTAEPKKLTLIADIAALTGVEIAKLAKSIVKMTMKITESRDEERSERKLHAKVVADMKRRHQRLVTAGELPADYAFQKYFERETGGKCPGRTQSLAQLFNSLVLLGDADGKPLISESIYDGAALDWLEKANAIVNSAIKAYGDKWKSSDEVQRAIKALSSPGDAAETLDKIRKEQKGTVEAAETAATEGQLLTPEIAVSFLMKHMGSLAGLVAAKPENGKELFCTFAAFGKLLDGAYTAQADVMDAFGKAYDEATLADWAKSTDTTTESGITVIGAAPTETAAPETHTEEKFDPDADAETPATETTLPTLAEAMA